MDKLKKFQPYQFWALLAVAVILPLVGWFMARSGFIAQAEAREKELASLVGSLSFSAEDPNQDWEKGLNELNSVQEKQVRIAWQQLYDAQKERMVWPKTVGQDPAKFELKEQNYYRNLYPPEIERLWKIPNPVVQNQDGTLTGLVEFPFEIIPRFDALWEGESRAPKIKEMMDAQEDIWLLTTLLKSIARVNESATSRYDAPVRLIQVIHLRGGGGTASSAGGAGGSADMMGGSSALAGGADAGGMTMPSMAGDAMGGAGEMGGDVKVSFDPSDEWGTEVPAADAGGATGGSATGADMAGSADPMGGAMAIPSMGGSSFGSSGMQGGGDIRAMAKMERYVEQNEKWKTRGFYLELVIDHTRLPDLLVSLSNSDWPVRITRVQQADLQEEELVDASGGLMAGEMGGAGSALGGAGSALGMGAGRPGGAMPPGLGGMGSAGMGSAGMGIGGMGMNRSRPMGAGAMTAGIDGTAANEPDALNDPNLVHVAIGGLITLYKAPPPEAAPADGAMPPSQGQDQTIPDVSSQGQPAAPTAAAVAGDTPAEESATPADSATPAAATAAEKPGPEAAKPSGDNPENKPAAEAPAKPDPAGPGSAKSGGT